MYHITEDRNLENHINGIKDKANSIIQNYIEIGFSLMTIRDNELYLEKGYSNLIECMEKELKMKKSTCYNLMRIAEKFGDQERKSIKEEYNQFGYMQLLEMTTMNEGDLQKVSPDMSKREIQQIKKDNSNRLEEPPVIDVEYQVVEVTDQDLFSREDALLTAIEYFYNHSWDTVIKPIMDGIERKDKNYISDTLRDYAIKTKSGGSIFVNGLHCLRECTARGFEIEYERLKHVFTWNEIAKKLLDVYSSTKTQETGIEYIDGQTSIYDTCANLGDPCTEKKRNDTCIGHDAALITYASKLNELTQNDDEEDPGELLSSNDNQEEIKEPVAEVNMKIDMVAACIQKAIDIFRSIKTQIDVGNSYNSSYFRTGLFNTLHSAHVLRPHSRFADDPYPAITVEGWDKVPETSSSQGEKIENNAVLELLRISQNHYAELMKPYTDDNGKSICEFSLKGRGAIFYEMGKQAALKELLKNQEVCNPVYDKV